MRSGEPWEDAFPLRGADGRYRWFLPEPVQMKRPVAAPERLLDRGAGPPAA